MGKGMQWEKRRRQRLPKRALADEKEWCRGDAAARWLAKHDRHGTAGEAGEAVSGKAWKRRNAARQEW